MYRAPHSLNGKSDKMTSYIAASMVQAMKAPIAQAIEVRLICLAWWDCLLSARQIDEMSIDHMDARNAAVMYRSRERDRLLTSSMRI